MLFVSRILFTVGALFASTRHVLERPDPANLVHLVHQSPSNAVFQPSSALMFRGIPSTPSWSPRIVKPRRPFMWGGTSTRVDTPITHAYSHPDPLSSSLNVTSSGLVYLTKQVTLTVVYYDGPTDLALYDDRRALAIYAPGPRDLAVYHRPSSVVVYTGPIDYVQFWSDLHSYQVVFNVYAPRFVDTPMLKQYAHLSREDFEHWIYEPILLGCNPSLFNLVYPSVRYLTIGALVRGPAEWASRVMTGLYVLGSLVTLAALLAEECVRLRKSLDVDHPRDQLAANLPQGYLLQPIQYSNLVLAEPKFGDQDTWWAVGEDTAQLGAPTLVLAHITSETTRIASHSQPKPRSTGARVINRRRGFLHALAKLESNKNGVRWDLD